MHTVSYYDNPISTVFSLLHPGTIRYGPGQARNLVGFVVETANKLKLVLTRTICNAKSLVAPQALPGISHGDV